jgi:hypothetical protein
MCSGTFLLFTGEPTRKRSSSISNHDRKIEKDPPGTRGNPINVDEYGLASPEQDFETEENDLTYVKRFNHLMAELEVCKRDAETWIRNCESLLNGYEGLEGKPKEN